MPRFPRREGEVVDLLDDVIQGLSAHAKLFPNSDLPGLQQVRDEYQAAREEQLRALAVYKEATLLKEARLVTVIRKLKLELRQAEIDSADNPAAMERIGWGGASETMSDALPGPPRTLVGFREKPGHVTLYWRAPERGRAGKVRFYEVERRPLRSPNADWAIAETTFENEVVLPNQPEGTEVEYRVFAKNKMGRSEPSNTVVVIL